jgi:translocation and assembly module TamB
LNATLEPPERSSDERSAQSSTPAPPPPRRRKSRRWLWLAPLAALLTLLAALAWLLGTEAGFRLSCRGLEQLAGGQLTLTAPTGSLAGSLSVQSIHWRDATLDVQLQELQFDWRPAELLQKRLSVARLAVASLRFASLPSDEPSTLPDSLRLPLRVDIEQLQGRQHRSWRLRAA